MIPRPCSYRAEKLNSAVFYVDDDPLDYDVERRNFQIDDAILDRLTTNTTLVCRNGNDASQFANYNDTDRSIAIFAEATTPWC